MRTDQRCVRKEAVLAMRTRSRLALICIAILSNGCKAHDTAPVEPVRIAVDLRSPESIARALFEAMRGELKAIAAHDRPAAAAHRAFIVERLVDPTLVPLARQQKNISDEEARLIFEKLIDSWESLAAYYIDGIELDAIRVEETPGNRLGPVMALAPARARGSSTTFRVWFTRNEPGEYRVLVIDFAEAPRDGMRRSPAASGSAPSSQPE